MVKNQAKVEELIKEVFIKLVEQSSYNEVTISTICETASISRKTFYHYFEDKQSLLKSILHDDLVSSCEQVFPFFKGQNPDLSSKMIIQSIFEGVLNRKAFYKSLVSRTHARIFINTMQEVSFDTISKLFGTPTKESADRFRYASRVGACAQAGLLVEWIRDDMRVPVETITEWTFRWMNPANMELGAISNESRLS